MTANHLDVHANLGPHPGGMPAQHTTLALHGALIHPHDRIRLRACPVPGCDFVTNQGRARLEKHLATHGTEKPFKCAHEGCGKAFKTSEHLKQHARCHATERNFRCARPLCEDHEAFKSLPELRLHESRMHTLDKAEAREMKLKEKVAKMEADAESARKDNATLRKAVELLQATLKEATAPRRPRKRKAALEAKPGTREKRRGTREKRRGTREERRGTRVTSVRTRVTRRRPAAAAAATAWTTPNANGSAKRTRCRRATCSGRRRRRRRRRSPARRNGGIRARGRRRGREGTGRGGTRAPRRARPPRLRGGAARQSRRARRRESCREGRWRR